MTCFPCISLVFLIIYDILTINISTTRNRGKPHMTSKDLIYQSIHIITEYYNNNLQPFFNNISEDILWLGPAEKQEIRGRDKVIATFSSEVHELTFTMGSIRAISITPLKTAHDIILQYEIYTHYPDGNTDLHNQRLHYSWYKKRIRTENGSNEHWEIGIIHISNAWPYDHRDTIYPNHYKYLGLPVRLIEKKKCFLTVMANDMSVHRIPIDCLLYIETIKKTAKLCIHTTTDTIIINGKLSDFENTYSDSLLRVHSGFLINPDHVSKIERFVVTMSNGTRIPVPEKKYTSIKHHILECSTTPK